MSTLTEYYANLLILQYNGLPKASQTIMTSVKPIIMDSLPIQVQNAYNLKTAEGVQLDVLGKYVGVSRQGYDFSGPVTLIDDEFRTLIQIKIFQNNSGSSLADIQNLISIFFPGELLVFDYLDMSIGYLMSTTISTVKLAQFFVKQGLLPRPMAVMLRPLVLAPVITNFFSFRTYRLPSNSAPFNTYADYQMDRPWLRYADAIII